jgi:hypothetical protein
MRRRWLFIPLLVSALFGGALSVFYYQFENYAKAQMWHKGVHHETANAMKHALAAARTYQHMRAVFGPETAAQLVRSLGYANEYAEQIVRFRNPDSPAELWKDLANNQIGIFTAQWLEEQKLPEQDIWPAIEALTQSTGLCAMTEEALVPATLRDKRGLALVRDSAAASREGARLRKMNVERALNHAQPHRPPPLATRK